MSLRFYARGELGKQSGNNPNADPTRRRIKKILSKGLRSHSGWRVVEGTRPESSFTLS